MEFFDSHCHLNREYLEEDPAAVIQRAHDADVRYLTLIGCGPTIEETRESVALAEQFENVYASVGQHPHEARRWDDTLEQQLRVLASHPKVVAIGECGLDYHYDNSPREQQRAAFRAQLQLADDVGKAVIIHNRSSDEDCIEILNEHYRDHAARGVIHCFSSSQALATCALELGFHLGFTGICTFKNAKDVQEVLRTTPIERIVIETDSPFLAPVPYRGKKNEPSYLPKVAEKVAELHGMSVADVAETTTANARALYGI